MVVCLSSSSHRETTGGGLNRIPVFRQINTLLIFGKLVSLFKSDPGLLMCSCTHVDGDTWLKIITFQLHITEKNNLVKGFTSYAQGIVSRANKKRKKRSHQFQPLSQDASRKRLLFLLHTDGSEWITHDSRDSQGSHRGSLSKVTTFAKPNVLPVAQQWSTT